MSFYIICYPFLHFPFDGSVYLLSSLAQLTPVKTDFVSAEVKVSRSWRIDRIWE